MVAVSDDCGPAAIWNAIAVGLRDPAGTLHLHVVLDRPARSRQPRSLIAFICVYLWLNRDLFGDLNSVSIQADDLAGMVGEQANGVQSEIGENLRAQTALVLRLFLTLGRPVGGVALTYCLRARAASCAPL